MFVDRAAASLIRTYYTSNTFAGIGVFDVFHAGAVAFCARRHLDRADRSDRQIPPSILVQAATGLGAPGAALGAHGIRLRRARQRVQPDVRRVPRCAPSVRPAHAAVYDLLGMVAGQSGAWQKTLGAFAVATGAVVATKARSTGF